VPAGQPRLISWSERTPSQYILAKLAVHVTCFVGGKQHRPSRAATVDNVILRWSRLIATPTTSFADCQRQRCPSYFHSTPASRFSNASFSGTLALRRNQSRWHHHAQRDPQCLWASAHSIWKIRLTPATFPCYGRKDPGNTDLKLFSGPPPPKGKWAPRAYREPTFCQSLELPYSPQAGSGPLPSCSGIGGA